ncbi:MAG TPA: pyridoxamine 5'-phosphate oxidase family protein [Desulfomicrobiaceae bacterium]|nr:pyridoxamine 5'-phosphate oxidase family protein [Desulfomicrobiaceae bacterium]
MSLKNYFEKTQGVGILSTSDMSGAVNAAVYSRPHVMDDGSISLIMNSKLSHKNVLENPKAHYLFMEDGPGYKGKRLSLTMLSEEENSERLSELCRRCYPSELEPEGKVRYLVNFRVEKELPLIGTKA